MTKRHHTLIMQVKVGLLLVLLAVGLCQGEDEIPL